MCDLAAAVELAATLRWRATPALCGRDSDFFPGLSLVWASTGQCGPLGETITAPGWKLSYSSCVDSASEQISKAQIKPSRTLSSSLYVVRGVCVAPCGLSPDT